MALDLGELVGFVSMDTRSGVQELKDFGQRLDRFSGQADAAGKKAGEAFGEGLADEAGRGGDEAADRAGEGLLTKGRLLAAAAGTAAGAAFVRALDIDSERDVIGAQLGLSPEDSARYGKIAGDLYAQAYGDSMGDVGNAVAAVSSSIEGMSDGSSKRLERVTAKALDFAQAFEVDVARSSQIAGQLIEAGLVKDAGQAFDQLVRSAQSVSVAVREDLLDAIDEYGPYFKTLGYSGEQAFALLVEGSRKGMIGIDKTGDAIKEFTVLATDMSESSKAAYATIGLDAEAMAAKVLAGGDSAQQATQDVVDGLLAVEDPVKRAQAALALFGTPLEDLNVREIPKFLRNLQDAAGGMDDVKGASKRMGDQLSDNAATDFKKLRRGIEVDVVNFVGKDVIPALERFGDWFSQEGGPALSDFADDMKPVVSGAKDLAGFLNDLPGPAKVAGVTGLFAAIAASKLRGGGPGLLGNLGTALNIAKPVPVIVMNKGFGVPGTTPGGPGKVPTVVPPVVPGGVPKVPFGTLPKYLKFGAIAGLDSAPGQDSLMKQITGFGLSGDGPKVATPAMQAALESATEAQGEFDNLTNKVGVFADALDLVGAKKIDPTLTVSELAQTHRDLQEFFELEIAAGRPITPYINTTSIERAIGMISVLKEGMHGVPTAGSDGGVPFLSGGNRAVDPRPAPFIHIDTVQAQDYKDFTRQLDRRRQQANLGGRPE